MKSITIVGVSKKLNRPSYKIFRYLSHSGYHTFLVNPNYSVIDQVECHENLESIKSPIDVVNIFENLSTFFTNYQIGNRTKCQGNLDAGWSQVKKLII